VKIGVGGERFSVRLLAAIGRLRRLSISLWESPKHPRVRLKWPAKPESGLAMPAKLPRPTPSLGHIAKIKIWKIKIRIFAL